MLPYIDMNPPKKKKKTNRINNQKKKIKRQINKAMPVAAPPLHLPPNPATDHSPWLHILPAVWEA